MAAKSRVRDGVFRWKGRNYRQVKRGTLIVEHGLGLEFHLTERGLTVIY